MSQSNIQSKSPFKSNSLPLNNIRSNLIRKASKVNPLPKTSPLQETNILGELDDLPQNTTLEMTPRKYHMNNLFQEIINPTGKENQPRFLSPLRISVSGTRSSSSNPKDGELGANQSDSSRAASPGRKNIINYSGHGMKEPFSEIRVFGPPSDNALGTPKSQLDLSQSGHTLKLSQVYTFDKAAKDSQVVENSQNELPEIMETACNEHADWDGKPQQKYIEDPYSSSSHKVVPKWKKLKSVFRSLVLFQNQEVRSINNAKAISQEVNSFALRTSPIPRSQDQKLKDQNDPLTILRRVEEFCQCAAIGSSDHIAHMKYLIKKDPKKFMLSPEDPLHFINTLNTQGQNALYIAAKNGNAEVVQLLIENNVNHLIKSKVNSNGQYEETALEVATRWGHQNIINMLFQHYKFDYKVVKGCLKMAPNSNVKYIIKEYMRKNQMKSRGFFFACSKY